MFVLRRILRDTMVYNKLIGSEYYIILKNEDTEAFNRIVERNGFSYPEKLFGFVHHSNGEHEPLIKNSRYYIMCSNGQTFEHIRDNA